MKALITPSKKSTGTAGHCDRCTAVNDSKQRTATLELDAIERLREAVGCLLVGGDPGDLDGVTLDLLVDVEPTDVDMLSPALRDRTLCQVDRWLIILVNLHLLD